MLDNYHADRNYISASGLKQIAISPRHYFERYLNLNAVPVSSPAMAFGNVVHTLMLEPFTFEQRYIVAPELDRRTKEGKQAYADFEALSEGKEVITLQDYSNALAMRLEARSSKVVTDLLDYSDKEQVYTFEIMGIKCKMKADAINDLADAIIDIKTCKDASPSGFGKDAFNLHYLLQAAFYIDGYYLATGINLKRFVFVAIEKTPPFITAVYELRAEQLELGRQQYLTALQTYKNCLEANDWQAYSKEIQPLQLPYWAK